MLPDVDIGACPGLAVPASIMHHVVQVESSFNPYAIGVVRGRLERQPSNLAEAVATAKMLENKGYNFSLGLAQVNRHNLARYGLQDYRRAFEACPNLHAGAKILAECHGRSGGDWGKSFSCYYSGNFSTGFRHGYVGKIYASMRGGKGAAAAIPLAGAVQQRPSRREQRISAQASRIETASVAPPSTAPRALSTAAAIAAPVAAAPAVVAPPSTDPTLAIGSRPLPTTQPMPGPQPDQAFVF